MPQRSSFFFAHLSSIVWALALAIPLGAEAQTAIPNGTTRFQATTAGNYTLAANVTRSVASGTNEAIQIGNTTGNYGLTIDGTVLQLFGGRGIRTTTNLVNFTITINATGLVQASGDDAIQGRGGPVTLTNLGKLYSGSNISVNPTSAQTTGRGLNLRDASGGTIINGAANVTSALIRADGGDAVRIGSNFSFTNYGTIFAAGVVNDASSNNVFNAPPNNNITETFSAGGGFSFEDVDATHGATNSTLINYGVITGARHGVQAGTAGDLLTVTNNVGGQIIGRNGSGVGFDTLEIDPSKIIVNNYGLIRGDYAGVGNIIDRTGNASFTNDGDGDGVDIDGAATIHNYSTGNILATGAGGYDSEGRLNTSDAVSIGGGVVVNDGLIQGANLGILVNNDTNPDRSGVAATSITNNVNASIIGQNGFAIRLENKYGDTRDNDTIVNYGTIIGNGTIPDPNAIVTLQDGSVDTNSVGTLNGTTYTGNGSARFIRGDGSAIQMGEGDDVLTNYGSISSNTGRAVNMEGGNDTMNFLDGNVTGAINGGTGTNTLNLGNGVAHSDGVFNFQNINVSTGTSTLSGVVSGTTLTKGGNGTLNLSGNNVLSGQTTVTAGTLRVNNTSGSATGTGAVVVNLGASLAGAGIISGNVQADGSISPGNSVGVLTVGGNVTWNGSLANPWYFDLSTGNLSDNLFVGGNFLKGTGTEFYFDFMNGTTAGTYSLVNWDGASTFIASDFSFINLAGGLTGSFAIHGSSLEFTAATAIPEPSTTAALFGAAVILLAGLRRFYNTRKAKTA